MATIAQELMGTPSEVHEAPTGPSIEDRRENIRRIDEEITRLALERTMESRSIGEERIAEGGPRIVLRNEARVIERYMEALGLEGRDIAMALLALGRGRLGRESENG